MIDWLDWLAGFRLDIHIEGQKLADGWLIDWSVGFRLDIHIKCRKLGDGGLELAQVKPKAAVYIAISNFHFEKEKQ